MPWFTHQVTLKALFRYYIIDHSSGVNVYYWQITGLLLENAARRRESQRMDWGNSSPRPHVVYFGFEIATQDNYLILLRCYWQCVMMALRLICGV